MGSPGFTLGTAFGNAALYFVSSIRLVYQPSAPTHALSKHDSQQKFCPYRDYPCFTVGRCQR